jgi:hypothetical protein
MKMILAAILVSAMGCSAAVEPEPTPEPAPGKTSEEVASCVQKYQGCTPFTMICCPGSRCVGNVCR